MKLSQCKVVNSFVMMPLNPPGGSTMQCVMGHGLLRLSVVVCPVYAGDSESGEAAVPARLS